MTSFGGPVAHPGYLREAFMARRRRFNETAHADLAALAQFLPGSGWILGLGLAALAVVIITGGSLL
jgi:chromate transporter